MDTKLIEMAKSVGAWEVFDGGDFPIYADIGAIVFKPDELDAFAKEQQAIALEEAIKTCTVTYSDGQIVGFAQMNMIEGMKEMAKAKRNEAAAIRAGLLGPCTSI